MNLEQLAAAKPDEKCMCNFQWIEIHDFSDVQLLCIVTKPFTKRLNNSVKAQFVHISCFDAMDSIKRKGSIRPLCDVRLRESITDHIECCSRSFGGRPPSHISFVVVFISMGDLTHKNVMHMCIYINKTYRFDDHIRQYSVWLKIEPTTLQSETKRFIKIQSNRTESGKQKWTKRI